MNSTAADMPLGKALYIRKTAVRGFERGGSLKAGASVSLFISLSERNE